MNLPYFVAMNFNMSTHGANTIKIPHSCKYMLGNGNKQYGVRTGDV